MFSKITAASLCVCNTSALITETRKQLPSTKMIDTQIKRETAMISNVVHEKEAKQENKMATNNEMARVNNLNARNRRTRQPQDINCNTTEKQQQQQQQPQQPLNRVMSLPNGSCNGKRSPKSLDIRKEEVMAIRNRFPTKVPIIVQRFCKETALPQLDKSKYLVPQEITMSQFLTIIRNRMRISSTQTLYLLVNNRSMISLSLTLAEVYNEYAGTDGFLYVTYASQEVFGAASTCSFWRVCPSDSGDDEDSPPNFNFAEDKDCNSSLSIEKHLTMNANESHFEAFLDNTYKSMCFG